MTFEEVVQLVPPTITLNSPSTQTTINLGQTITLSATASKPNGNIIGVSFYAGNTLLTTVNTAPFTYQWTPTAAGTYTISAEAFDTDGLSTKTSSITVIVKTIVTGLENKFEANGQSVFPNPFGNDGLRINYKGNFHYQITDLKGVILLDGIGTENIVVGGDLKPGNYLLTIENEQGKHVQKIVRQ